MPEEGFREYKTKQKIITFICENTDLELIDRESYFYFRYTGNSDKTVCFRADIDAVNVNGSFHHYCGHDGHTAILCALALAVSETKPSNNVIFLFQSAEETGQGAIFASAVIEEEHIDEIYGLHNLPGEEENLIVISDRTFACASTGLEITITGTPAHAAYPEQGKNPSAIITKIIDETEKLTSLPHKGLMLSTVIGVEIGSSNYGVSADKGILRLTVRGEFQTEFRNLVDTIKSYSENLCQNKGFEIHCKEIEAFPATQNYPESVSKLEAAANKAGYKFKKIPEPKRWSEDFGHYLLKTKGAFFGIGIGSDTGNLHQTNYCFNDSIIKTAIDIYSELLTI